PRNRQGRRSREKDITATPPSLVANILSQVKKYGTTLFLFNRFIIRFSQSSSSRHHRRDCSHYYYCTVQGNWRRSRIRKQPGHGRSSRQHCDERRHHFNSCIPGPHTLYRRARDHFVIAS
ncbi:unnamed protein product, partial [Sphacelaria rigidula]